MATTTDSKRGTRGSVGNDSGPWTETMKCSPKMVVRVGSENIRDPHTAFIELIKNAYDADATYVRVEFRTGQDREFIVIQDNGEGMDREGIGRWFRAGGESKVIAPYTPRFRRRKLGAKGIGRFSAGKLGDRIKIRTRTKDSPKQLTFDVNFREFTDDRELTDMRFPIRPGTPKADLHHGTEIRIYDLSIPWGKAQVRKLRNNLALLIDPEGDEDFHIYLDHRDYPDLSGRIESPIAGRETHRITFEIDAKGNETVEVSVDEKSERSRKRLDPPSFGPIRGTLLYYREGLKRGSDKLARGSAETHMGVKIYRDGCRVRPYGEEGDDWLEVSRKKLSGGGRYFVKPKHIAGAIKISAKENPDLRDASDRESGMDSNQAFQDLQEYVSGKVAILNGILEKEAQARVQKERRENLSKILDTVVDCLNREESDVYSKFLDRIDRQERGEHGVTTKEPRHQVRDVKSPRNVEWKCLNCRKGWRAPKGQTPRSCMDLAVDRSGRPRNLKGCGSQNIERSTHTQRGDLPVLESIVSGKYALVSGKQIRVSLSDDMGEMDPEYDWDGRVIRVNMRHPAFRVAQNLDRSGESKYDLGDAILWPAQTMHITKCVCMAWGELHFEETKDWSEFRDRYDRLLETVTEALESELTHA